VSSYRLIPPEVTELSRLLVNWRFGIGSWRTGDCGAGLFFPISSNYSFFKIMYGCIHFCIFRYFG
jgi:hypothetical protein